MKFEWYAEPKEPYQKSPETPVCAVALLTDKKTNNNKKEIGHRITTDEEILVEPRCQEAASNESTTPYTYVWRSGTY